MWDPSLGSLCKNHTWGVVKMCKTTRCWTWMIPELAGVSPRMGDGLLVSRGLLCSFLENVRDKGRLLWKREDFQVWWGLRGSFIKEKKKKYRSCTDQSEQTQRTTQPITTITRQNHRLPEVSSRSNLPALAKPAQSKLQVVVARLRERLLRVQAGCGLRRR